MSIEQKLLLEAWNQHLEHVQAELCQICGLNFSLHFQPSKFDFPCPLKPCSNPMDPWVVVVDMRGAGNGHACLWPTSQQNAFCTQCRPQGMGEQTTFCLRRKVFKQIHLCETYILYLYHLISSITRFLHCLCVVALRNILLGWPRRHRQRSRFALCLFATCHQVDATCSGSCKGGVNGRVGVWLMTRTQQNYIEII